MDKEYSAELKERVAEASALFKSGHLYQSLALCYQILERHPFQGQTLQLIGLIQINQGKHHDAIVHMERSLTELQDDPIAHCNLAAAYQLVGNRKKAEEHNWRAATLDPDYPDPYFNLIMLTNLDDHLNLIKPILRLIQTKQLNTKQKALLHFAAGKYYHHAKDYQHAFSHFKTANHLLDVKYDPSIHHQLTQATIKTFNKELFRNYKKNGRTRDGLVFLIGMPVCGTNPIDVTLSRHTDVKSLQQNTHFLVLAHELNKVRLGNRPYPDCVSALTPEKIKACADIYLKHIDPEETSKHLINSFPLNFNFVGLIKLLFPEARFIHCQRQPLDTCLVSFFNWLPTHFLYSYNLSHIMQYYLDYLKLMQHWRNLFPDDILDLEFETLVKTPKKVIQTASNFLGLDPENNSTTEILEPRYHYEVGFSDQYAAQLDAVINRLKPYIDSYNTQANL